MSEAQMKNLDIQCAELGREIAQISGIDENLVNEALTVLEEQGPYAMFLYLKAKNNNVAKEVRSESLQFLKTIFGNRLDTTDDILEAIKLLANSKDLDDLLFARDLLRTAFSYARYHLKAKQG